MNELEMRDGVKLPRFAEKTAGLFPDVVVPCVYELWRKLIAKDNHDKPLDKWAADDKFLLFAKAQRGKLLSVRKDYKREMVWGGAFHDLFT